MTLCKAEFSNSQNANIQRWESFVKGPANRQQFLATALKWVSKGNVDVYMSAHRKDTNIKEIKTYFNTVIDWADNIFNDIYPEMQGLNWGDLYERFHANAYNHNEVISTGILDDEGNPGKWTILYAFAPRRPRK
mgnify:CR=1 FL=1